MASAAAHLDSAIARLSSWRPYEPPLATFPRDWRSDVPSWLERVCDPEAPPTAAWTWQRLALLARHAEGRVALEAHATLAESLLDPALSQHLQSHAYQQVHTFEDHAGEHGLDFYTRVVREIAEALIEAIAVHDKCAGESLRQAACRADIHACRHAHIGPAPAMRPTQKNLVWKDDHQRLLANATPLDWWHKYGLVREVLATTDPETEARLRHTAMSILAPGH